MTALIRRMTEEDVPAVFAIDRSSFSLPWSERSFRHEVTANPVARCWVVEREGEVAAMLVLWLIEDEAHIATIATHPGHRRQGLAERILIEALQEAKKEGGRRAFLEVRRSNSAAQAMYHKYGFKQDGIRPHYYRDNQEDAILMSLEDLHTLPAAAGNRADLHPEVERA